MNFGENLIAIRKTRGMSRKALAEKLGIPYTTLRNYETGQREPGHKILIAIACIFSVSVDELIGFKPPQKQKPAAIRTGHGGEYCKEVWMSGRSRKADGVRCGV